jgi:uncharacterized protein (DUF2141 family)
MNRASKILLGIAAELALANACFAFDLTVEVLNAKSEQGEVAAGLYDARTEWLQEPLRGLRVPAADKVTIVYRDLPAGTYAVAAYHDQNGNRILDKNLLGVPKERVGFSRDSRALLGPPGFEASAFELNSDMTITVRLH